MTDKLYKGRYEIVFYSKDGETLIRSFNNVREILEYRDKPITRTNVNLFNVELYRALRSETHITQMLDGQHQYTVYLHDINEDYDTDFVLIEASSGRYVDRNMCLTRNVQNACRFSKEDVQTLLNKCCNTAFRIVEFKEEQT